MAGLKFKETHNILKAVLFDMDGVLVDSTPQHVESWNHVLTDLNLPPLTNEWYFSVIGRVNRDLLSCYSKYNHIKLSKSQIEILVTRKEETFRNLIMQKAELTPGVIEWLTFLKQNDIFCSVASSATMANIVLILHTLKIADYFASIISGKYFPASKPDPQIFLAAAASVGSPAEECLVIEDAPAGIQAAKSAKMLCCAIATSFPKASLARADIILESLAERSPDSFFE